jgi:hypothetical protein
MPIPSEPALLGPLDLEDLALGLDVGQSILVHILATWDGLHLSQLILALVLVQQRVFEVGH